MKYISFFLLLLFFVKSEAIEFQSVELDKAYSRSIPALKIIDSDGDGDDDLFFSSIHFNEQRPGFALFKNTNNYFSYEFIDEVINPYINQACDGADEYSGEIFYASTIINPESGNLINYNLGGCTLHVIEKNNQGVFEGTALYDPNLTDDSINLYGMGDFNADGKLDFVALNYPSMEFIAHIKNNVGGYDQINIDVSNYDGNPPGFGVRLPGFFIKDMNSDGYDDIIFSGQQNFVGMASFLKSDGQTFTSSSMIEDYQFSMGDIELGSLAVDDFDENGLLDFVVKRGIEIKLISQTGVGVFTETPLGYEDYDLADSPYVLYVDEDQDGDRDLIFVDVYTGDTENDVVLVENVQGEFKNKSILFTSEYLITQLLTFEYEGKIQLVSVMDDPYSSSSNKIAIKYEKSNGEYSPKMLDKNNLIKYSNTGAGKVAYIDIDMDGDQDVIIADEFELSQVYLFRNQGSDYIKELLIELPSQIRDIKVADINGDNLNDLIIASTSYKVDGDTKEFMLYVTSYINNSNSLQYLSSQSFSGIYNFPTINRDVMRFEDLENDGDQDLFIRRNMWLENSEGVYSDPKLTSPDTAPGFYGMLIEDLDGDNIREYVWTDGFFGPFSSSQDINISKFDEASSSFIKLDSTGYTSNSTFNSRKLFAIDLNHDGIKEIVLENRIVFDVSTNEIVPLDNNLMLYQNGSFLTYDINSDGVLDLFPRFISAPNNLSWYELTDDFMFQRMPVVDFGYRNVLDDSITGSSNDQSIEYIGYESDTYFVVNQIPNSFGTVTQVNTLQKSTLLALISCMFFIAWFNLMKDRKLKIR